MERLPFYVGIITLISISLGAIFPFVLNLTPLKNYAASHLPHTHASLTGFLPATLKHPVNILILGIDNSGHPHQGKFTPTEALAGNSDTLLLVRLVPNKHQINVLSIPRDTLVRLPDIGIDKINDANVRGGSKLAAETVSQLLNGVTIDRYVRVDTEGFIHLVDALGGVEVNIPKKMDYIDHTQHLDIHFSPGRQKLNGQHLQEYVRFRHDALGDIGRVQRQQEVLREILHTALQPATIAKVPQIMQVVKENVETDLSVEEILAIAQTVATNNRHQMHLLMLPGRFSSNKEYKRSYWISDSSATAGILSRYFDVQTANALDTQVNSVQPQTLRIAVENATGQPEVAKTVVSVLKKHGFRNVYVTHHEIDTGVDSAGRTQIIAQHGNPEAANAVSSTLGTGQVMVASVGDILSDVTVVIGADLVEKLKLQYDVVPN
ncbi:LytR family transcriptional regulator [Brasilonema octagenarum UFV-E1]|uniref:LytR family transcriptional regulator n=2 Tax=Bromeliae group (in: Brasilonema) TaxID=3398495 RepID=A0A856MD77_9CYAN|nr:LytR family transcriptional regulator [Brasilonema sennae CENA114]QDL13289.1 LytR family transcriptional regulator [Brasilonema octagenarum UFV-E1]